MRCVKERHAFASDRERNTNLLGNRIVARGFHDRPEILAQRAERRPIAGPAEQDVLGLAIDPRQMTKQVADVSADPEVVELTRVDADAH